MTCLLLCWKWQCHFLDFSLFPRNFISWGIPFTQGSPGPSDVKATLLPIAFFCFHCPKHYQPLSPLLGNFTFAQDLSRTLLHCGHWLLLKAGTFFWMVASNSRRRDLSPALSVLWYLELCIHSTFGTREISTDNDSGLQLLRTTPWICPFLPTWGSWVFSQSSHMHTCIHYLELHATGPPAVPPPAWSSCTSARWLKSHYTKGDCWCHLHALGFQIYLFEILIFNNYRCFFTPETPNLWTNSSIRGTSTTLRSCALTFVLVRPLSVSPGPRLFEGKLLII